ncbi:FIST C-terminal domain-containing protein [Actibacterium sp. 188UL27-1]|nr:FIST C-terminal domain-containing protein [Actibacterium sp. 188UL27-1]
MTGETQIAALAPLLGSRDLSLVCLFVSPLADFDDVARQATEVFDHATVIACTTAGEIGANGYTDGQIVATALPSASFATTTLDIRDLSTLDPQSQIDRVVQARSALASQAPGFSNEFAFLMIDGLSMREDELTAMLASGLGPVPLFGGSAGDGTDFQKTHLALGKAVLQDAALLTLVRTACPIKVFSLDHLIPTERRMVVTRADPSRRVVQQINAEPAATEYARILGKDPGQLDQFTFAAHPLVVRLGGRHHVRAIQRVNREGELIFFSAIDEGAVLTLAEPEAMDQHLDRELNALAQGTAPAMVLACDCLLRRLEAGQRQMTHKISKILTDNNVVGFSTYGEQYRAMHVNHTMTGVAIYPAQDQDIAK